MAQNYTRQSSFADGDTITAALFNNEFNQVVNAFAYSASSDSSTGHKHDGTTGQGGNVPQIGDIDFLNKIVVDNTNNRWGFYVQVSSGTVEQLRIQDGAIVPVTNNDIDLGTSSLEFKDLFIDGTAHIDTLDVDVNATVAGTLGVTGASTLTGNVTATNDLSVGGNLTVTGNATIAGNLTFGDAATDTVAFSADVASNLLPSVDNTYDLGAAGSEWKDLYIDGTANIDSLVADTVDINGGTVDSAIIGGTTPAALSATTGSFSSTLGVTGATTLEGLSATSATITNGNGAITLHRTNAAGVAITQLISDNVGKWQVGMQGSTDDYSVYDVDASANRLTINATTGAATFNSSVTATGTSVFASLDISGDIDVDGTTNLDVVDIDGAVDMASTLQVDGISTFTGQITANGGMEFVDNKKLTFGAGDDLEIYHDGLNSYINDVGTGNILIRGANVLLTTGGGTKYLEGGSNVLTLFHTGNERFRTTNTGVDVTGSVTADGLTVDGTLASPPIVRINNSGGTWAVGDEIGRLQFYTTDISGLGTRELAAIRATTYTGGATGDGTLEFWTSPYNSVAKKSMEIDGTTGDVSFYEDTGTTAKMTWDASAESLGIGSATPSATYSIDATKGMRVSSAAPNYTLTETDASSQSWIMGSLAGNFHVRDVTGGTYPFKIEAATPTNTLYLDSAGLVGIGTSSPARTLEVNAGSTQVATVIGNTNGTRVRLTFKDANTTNDSQVGVGAEGNELIAHAGGAERLRIDSSGRLGIGTSAPQQVLQISQGASAGTTALRIENTETGIDPAQTANAIEFYTNDVSAGGTGVTGKISHVAVNSGTTYDLTFSTYNATALLERLRIAYNGDVSLYEDTGTTPKFFWDASAESLGIGTSTPTYTLDVASGAANNQSLARFSSSGGVRAIFNTDSDDDGSLSLYDKNDVAKVLIRSLGSSYLNGGSLGIGTSSPSLPLHVNGGTGNQIGLFESTDATVKIGFKDSATTNDYSVTIGAVGDDMTFSSGSGGTERMRIASDGSLSTPTLGTSNVRFGVNAGNSITSGGNYNTLVGDNAGTAITTGMYNTAVGTFALDVSTTASNNTALGYATLSANLAGTSNVAVGRNAMLANTTGIDNVAVGAYSLDASTTGSYNTSVGKSSLGANVTGINNVAIGQAALASNTNGHSSVAIGQAALAVQNYPGTPTTAYNTAVGHGAGNDVTTGVKNTLIGALAGSKLVDTDYNTAIGNNALAADTYGSRSIAIGHSALAVQNFTSATVASNTAVGFQAGVAVSTGKYNTTLGGLSSSTLTTGVANVMLGYKAGSHAVLLTTGSNNVLVGAYCDPTAVDTSNANGFGYNVDAAADYTTLGNGVNDIRAAHGNVTWSTVSDERYKKDIVDSSAGLSFVNALRPRTFKYKTLGELPEAFNAYEADSTEVFKNSDTNHGFIAQEIKAAIDADSSIADGFRLWDDREDGSQEVAEAALIPILVKAIQEQNALIESLTARIETLEG